MFEKVNPSHPDKLADRIAGALVDYAYALEVDPTIAVEVLLGHGQCNIIAETSVMLDREMVRMAVRRIAGRAIRDVWYVEVPQDPRLAQNQRGRYRCGDNGIFKGVPVTDEQRELSRLMHALYDLYPTDGKAVLDGRELTICQSCMTNLGGKMALVVALPHGYRTRLNPIGPWTGGPDVDCGATNRKLGSDMGDAVTGGGLHGKDLSKADVSVNIACHMMAQKLGEEVRASCAIGDTTVRFRSDGMKPIDVEYRDVIDDARTFVRDAGGFESLAEWGLI